MRIWSPKCGYADMECGYADMEPEMWICGYEEKPLCADPPDVDMKTEPPNSTETRIVDMKIDPTKRSRGEIVDMKNILLRGDNPQPRLSGIYWWESLATCATDQQLKGICF